MKFFNNQVYHIYNQGNNSRQIFHCKDNYEYFLWKMRIFLLPFGDLLAYCLMPNHFHWLFRVKYNSIARNEFRQHYDKMEVLRRESLYGDLAIPIKRPEKFYEYDGKKINLNRAIGTLLSSYTQALNKRYGNSGSLFRSKCQAKNGFLNPFASDPNDGMNKSKDCVSRCFHYIHSAPVRARLADYVTEYLWSSALEYQNRYSNPICNLDLAKTLVNETLNLDKLEDYLRDD